MLGPQITARYFSKIIKQTTIEIVIDHDHYSLPVVTVILTARKLPTVERYRGKYDVFLTVV